MSSTAVEDPHDGLMFKRLVFTVATVGCAGILAAGCGSSSSATPEAPATTAATVTTADLFPGIATCADWTTRPVPADELEAGCHDGSFFAGTAVYDCTDGRQLAWNDYGWGSADEPFTKHAEGAEKVAPANVRADCGLT